MIEPEPREPSISRKCQLLGLSRSSFYYAPCPISPEDLELMRLIDEQCLITLVYAVHQAVQTMGPTARSRISKTLDFMAVTDHSEYMDVLPGIVDPKNPLAKHPMAKKILSDDPAERMRAGMKVLDSMVSQKPIPKFVDPAVTRSVWQEIIKAAESHNQPGKFTTFIGYEWSSNGLQGKPRR